MVARLIPGPESSCADFAEDFLESLCPALVQHPKSRFFPFPVSLTPVSLGLDTQELDKIGDELLTFSHGPILGRV
jgi:hypothetical protein